MAVHADNGDGGAAEESASFAEDATFESPADPLQEVPGCPGTLVAPLGQQASKSPLVKAVHELGDPKSSVHRLPGISMQ